MAERMNDREVGTFEELLRSCVYEGEALRRILVRKGILSDQEVLDEIRALRQELEVRRAR